MTPRRPAGLATPRRPAGLTKRSVTTEFLSLPYRPGVRRLMRSPSTGRVEVPFSARFHFARSGRNPDGMLVEGLRISWMGRVEAMTAPGAGAGRFDHRPVMVDEVVALLAPSPPGVLLDATLGGAGHARALLDAAPHLHLIGLDQDPVAVAAATAALAPYGARARVQQARFDRIPDVLEALDVGGVSAVLFDLGVSSPQLDRAERGFSYRQDGPLDMRMDPGGPISASDIVNHWTEETLTRLFRDNGEPRFARRIARAVIAARPIRTTVQFSEVVRGANPAATRRTGGHPSRRVFQAVRIAVNEELEILPSALDAAMAALVPSGRCAVLAYHSGEDRIVKERFRLGVTGGCQCPPGLPCMCGAEPVVRLLIRGARRPSQPEVDENRRAESARLRAVERLPASDPGGVTTSRPLRPPA
jgi:16S rRNA (cytosine1402-N4)-methyltransferase